MDKEEKAKVVEEDGKRFRVVEVGGKQRKTRLYRVGDNVGGYVTKWVSEEANLFIVSSPSGKVFHLAQRFPDRTFHRFPSFDEAKGVGELLVKAEEKERLSCIYLYLKGNALIKK